MTSSKGILQYVLIFTLILEIIGVTGAFFGGTIEVVVLTEALGIIGLLRAIYETTKLKP